MSEYESVDWPSWIQAISAVVTTFVTVSVAWYAKRSADTADNALAAALKALEESRKSGEAAQASAAAALESTRISASHFEREWKPHIEILDMPQSGAAICGINVLNLGSKDAILLSVIMKRQDGLHQPSFTFPLHLVAPSGRSLVVQLSQAFNVYYQHYMNPGPQRDEITLLVHIHFKASGAEPANTNAKKYRVTYMQNGFNRADELAEE